MATSTDLALNLLEYYTRQKEILMSLTIFLIVGGRILYILSYLLLYFAIKIQMPDGQKFENWRRFLAKEMLLAFISIANNLAAIAIFSYAIMASGVMLCRWAVIRKKPLTKLFGYLFYPILPPLGVIGFSIFIYFENPLEWELGALVAAWVGFEIKRFSFPKSRSDNLERALIDAKSKALWYRTPKFLKIALLISLIVAPLSLYGIFYTQVYAAKINYMVEMRDGTKLMTRVYFPPNWKGEAHSIVLCRTPYDSDADNLVNSYVSKYVSRQGFILVLQDMRGCHASQGDFPVFQSDSTDGVDTVRWLMDQSWCSGNIASVGGSAVCTNQYYYHAERPAGMKAANLLMGASELYDYWFFPGGCFRKSFSDWWLPAVTTETEIARLYSHPEKDAYWAPTSLAVNERFKNVDIRAVHVGGWYDVFQQGTLTGFEYYSKMGTDHAKNHQILIMGPWGHGPDPVHPDITYPDTQGWNLIDSAEAFVFGEALAGETRNWDEQPRVYYYVMGDPDGSGSTVDFNQWRTGDTWPINTTPQPWYFHSNGTLSPNVPLGASNASYIFDPSNPVSTRGGNTLFSDPKKNAAMDQAPVENGRTDILSYLTPVLSNPVEIIGRLRATLYIKSNCTDTDFTVKLMDVFPDGRQMYVASGILKARYRTGFTPEQTDLMTPGQVYCLNIDMWSTAYRFVPGHQIKVSISSSNYPEFAVNPNTGVDVFPIFEEFYYANNTVLLGQSGQLSAIWFPRSL